jgi:hypothetical protein
MPDLIGHLTIKQKRTQKRHLTWAEMPLKCFEIVTLYDNDKVTNYIDSRKNKPIKRKESAVTPHGGPMHSCVMTDFSYSRRREGA